MTWRTIEDAPKNGKPFLAWYKSDFGPPFGTMKWEPEPKGNGGRFHSMTMGTQTKCATHWMDPEAPDLIDDCDHEWVDATNEVVQSGELCFKCNAIRATPIKENS